MIRSAGTTPNVYLYCGERWDSDLGLYYLRARYLNPGTGRFMTMDTFEGTQSDPASLHKYLYASANPVNLIDPSGFDIEFDSGRGIKAHTVFGLYCLSRGIPCIPGATLGVTLPHLFPKGSYGANEKPDCVDQGNSRYFELKPISHQVSSFLQFEDAIQMAKYDKALRPHQFYRGDSEDFVTPGTLAGSFEHEGKEYAVLLYPEGKITSGGYNGQGLIYYDLKEIKPNSPWQKLLREVTDNPMYWLIPTGIKIGAETSLQTGRLMAARALARPVGMAVGSQIMTRVGLQTVIRF